MQDPHSEIARLEREIESVAAENERCRRFDLGAKLAMLAGAAWLGTVFFGLARGDTATTLLAIAALVGGIVVYGSNRSSWRSAAERQASAEARRARLIDDLDMRVVRGEPDWRRIEH